MMTGSCFLKHVLVTGGTGFIGGALIPALLLSGWKVDVGLRDEEGLGRLPDGVRGVVTGDLDLITAWKPFLEGVDGIVHLAARVHQMKEDQQASEEAHQRMNVTVTQVLAVAAGDAGVRRLVFISSVKAMGESTLLGEAWNESVPCAPHDAYGRSKLDAERTLIEISRKTGLEVVILRLPLIYGPGVKANMVRLFRGVDKGFHFPLGTVDNLRSLLYVGNVVDAIRVALEHPAAAGETFLVSDGEDVSTPELIRRIARALCRPARLLPFPPFIMRLVGRMTGNSAKIERLLSSLVIDSSKIQRVLSWKPPYTMEQGLKQTADWYNSKEHKKHSLV